MKTTNKKPLTEKDVRNKFIKVLTEKLVMIKLLFKLHKNISKQVSISNGNMKMGAVASVSLLPLVTCPAACRETCGKFHNNKTCECYAVKLANLRPTVLDAWARNTAIALNNPDAYFKRINETCKTVRFFRFHVSGDIPNKDYFRRMIKTARDNPNCEILAFTKNYKVVNDWIDKNGKLPENLHILFSGWENYPIDNPHNLPTTNIYRKEQDIKDDWKLCGGNCLNCACRGVGCWQAQNGDTIAFKKH